ncbi:Ig-like domain repeat protein [uncultured Microbacterium sp.]|uniref:Ig-like domain repeat protein n=1 Tax=uncultured Microbacterium sp. TaxID=191216 RepID=UPI0035CA5AC6
MTLVTIAAIALAGLTSVPVAAHAAESDIPPTWGTTLGTLHLEPSSGSFSEKTLFTRAWTDNGFSASQRGGAMLVVSQIYPQDSDLVARRGFLADINVIDENVDMTGPFSWTRFQRSLGDASLGLPLTDGKGSTFTILLAGFRNGNSFFVPSQENYVAHGVIEGDTWRIVDVAGPTKTATTTTLASSEVTQTGATLTATVAPNEATGTVQFKKDGSAIGTPAAVSGGIATTTLTDLTAATAYAFTAEYSGDATHEASAGSVGVTTQAVPSVDTSESTVGVTVPTAATPTPTGLKISVKPQAITLTGSTQRTVGQTWEASGELGTVEVKDDRQITSGSWTLNGRVSALSNGDSSISASNVGWTPTKVSGAGTAGAAVTAGENGGLTGDKPLATGTASTTPNVTTQIGAGITLKTPADAPAGNYTGTITLTLI